ncbi:MAG: hypothetical protein FJ214_04085 [Ignavibacteria bacterium]|nr:hypothetical protein [Ignavibacteria bacterium]
MRKLFLISLIILISNEINALPRFALMQKDKCIDCHVNPTGGIIRNENGFFFGKNVISLISPREQDIKLSPKLTDNVLFGFDYRSQILYSNEKKRADFQDMTGSLYLSASVSEKIDVLAKYDFVNSIWEGYGIARILPNNSYIKIGSFVPYFGVRLDDHTSYTRGGDFGLLFSQGISRGLIYNPFYVETSLEFGVNISNFGLFTASIGKNRFNMPLTSDPNITTRFEVNQIVGDAALMIGGSFASVKTKFLGNVLNTKLYGGFAGIGFNRFSMIGEYDKVSDYLAKDAKSTALMVEVSYLLNVGLEAIMRYDRFDPNTNADKDEHAHLTIGLEFFPYSFIELRPQYRIKIEEPEVSNNSFVLQFHFWY